MSIKNLNLSLDDDTPETPAARLKRYGRRRSAANSPPAPMLAPDVPARRSPLWPTLLLMLLANIALVVAAADWLTGGDLGNLAQRPQSLSGSVSRMEVQLASLEVRMGELAGMLQPQLAQQEQSGTAVQAMAASLAALQSELTELRAQMQVTLTPTDTASQADEWLLNLGSFEQVEDAAALVKRSQALGYEPEVIERTEAGKPLYLVALPGFDERSKAETRAQDIMEKTDLNGLWAWKR